MNSFKRKTLAFAVLMAAISGADAGGAPPTNTIPLVEVQSSQIYAVGYDAGTQTLVVQFTRGNAPGTRGSTYKYDNVPADIHSALMAAESKGRYHREVIKAAPDKYPFTRIADAPPAETKAEEEKQAA